LEYSVSATSPTLQRTALLAVCASAAVFIGSWAWQIVGVLEPVLGLFFGGWLLACVLEPVVASVMRRTRTARSAAVLITYLALVLAMFLLWLFAGRVLGHQFDSGLRNLPATLDVAVQSALGALAVVNAWLAERGLSLQLDPGSVANLGGLARQLDDTALGALAVLGGALGIVGSLATMLLLSVLFLVGGPQLADQVVEAVGCRAAGDVRFVLTTVHDTFESFVRAQLVQSVLYGAGVWTCMTIAGIDAAPLVAGAAGLLLLVPVIGPILAVGVTVLVTLGGNLSATLAVAAALVLLEQLVLNVVGPRLMSQRLGLPPLLVFFAILAGGQVAGVWGAVFGIPVLATCLTCAGYFRQRWSD